MAELPLEQAALLGFSGDHAEGVLGRREVFGALARLPADQREVIVLRFYGDLSVAETAAATDASPGTVKSRTSRALARMRELLAESTPAPLQPASLESGDRDRRAAH